MWTCTISNTTLIHCYFSTYQYLNNPIHSSFPIPTFPIPQTTSEFQVQTGGEEKRAKEKIISLEYSLPEFRVHTGRRRPLIPYSSGGIPYRGPSVLIRGACDLSSESCIYFFFIYQSNGNSGQTLIVSVRWLEELWVTGESLFVFL